MSTWLTLQYTLTETHVGGAGTSGPVDLPIAREATTGLPFLPDTALKGVVRDTAERLAAAGPASSLKVRDADALLGWVGGDTVGQKVEGERDPSRAGALTITQGHLLAYPLRSLQRPFVYATSALLLGRLARLAAAFDLPLPDAAAWRPLLRDQAKVRVASKALAEGPVVVEQLAYPKADVIADPAAAALGKVLAAWFTGDARKETGALLAESLVILPDADLVQLARVAPPVRARVRLDEHKSTSGDDGNLWYEEMLPSDCLFWSIFQVRRAEGGLAKAADALIAGLASCQLGAGESTGHGRCWWWPATSKGA